MSDSTPWSVASLIAETKAQLRDRFAQLNVAIGERREQLRQREAVPT